MKAVPTLGLGLVHSIIFPELVCAVETSYQFVASVFGIQLKFNMPGCMHIIQSVQKIKMQPIQPRQFIAFDRVGCIINLDKFPFCETLEFVFLKVIGKARLEN